MMSRATKSDTFYYVPQTCPAVDKIMSGLEWDIERLFDNLDVTDFHGDIRRAVKELKALINDATKEIKEQTEALRDGMSVILAEKYDKDKIIDRVS